MTFLEQWDQAIQNARESGKPGLVWKLDRDETDMAVRLLGRTMHPSFMALPVAKHDPVRDQYQSDTEMTGDV